MHSAVPSYLRVIRSLHHEVRGQIRNSQLRTTRPVVLIACGSHQATREHYGATHLLLRVLNGKSKCQTLRLVIDDPKLWTASLDQTDNVVGVNHLGGGGIARPREESFLVRRHHRK